jgi:hypothetical protein
MKKILFLFSLVYLSFANIGFAQDHDEMPKGKRKEKIEAAKIALISTNIDLTTEQAKTFWPLYNEYSDKRKDIRKEMKTLRVENALLDASDDELLIDMKKMMALRKSEVDLEREYFDKFLKVISPKQLAKLYKTEREFSKMLLKRLREE